MSTRDIPVVRLVIALTLLAACADRHHPENFASGPVHGVALKQQTEDCRQCHGEELAGGDAEGCDGCHTGATVTAWRSDCTFCHGGVANDTGAPPRNLDGTDQVGPFPVHTIHVTGSTLASPFDCTQCHVKATDVLSPGHVFDSTPGEAENDFGSGLSPQAQFQPSDHSCSGLYCHGSGRGDDGAVAALDGPRACDSCHPSQAQGALGWSAMSGLHMLHLATPSAIACSNCHQATTTDGETIAAPELHVDGLRQVMFDGADAGFTYDTAMQTCTGTCHGVDHPAYGWGMGGASPHPDGYAARELHGTDMELQRLDCRGCHGANLEGGTGQSCDGCHTEGWREDCTFCHGGGLNQTGAPPQDLGSAVNSVAQSFVAHTKHVTRRIASAFDCVQCHSKPTDVMSLNHAFDTTPAAAEITMAAGLSPAGAYNGTGTCSSTYCHGNGRGNNGTYTDGNGPLSCAGCHPGQASTADRWQTMSGDHKKHLADVNMTCDGCHQTVAGLGGTSVIAPQLHVDGAKQVSMQVTTITWNPATRRCTGPCHGEDHQSEAW